MKKINLFILISFLLSGCTRINQRVDENPKPFDNKKLTSKLIALEDAKYWFYNQTGKHDVKELSNKYNLFLSFKYYCELDLKRDYFRSFTTEQLKSAHDSFFGDNSSFTNESFEYIISDEFLPSIFNFEYKDGTYTNLNWSEEMGIIYSPKFEIYSQLSNSLEYIDRVEFTYDLFFIKNTYDLEGQDPDVLIKSELVDSTF